MGDTGIRQNTCAIDDDEGIRGRIAEGVIDDISDGPCQGTGLIGRRYVAG